MATRSPTDKSGAGRRHLHDLTRDLMTENQRRLDNEIAGTSMPEIVHVRSADPASAEVDANHSRRERHELELRPCASLRLQKAWQTAQRSVILPLPSFAATRESIPVCRLLR